MKKNELKTQNDIAWEKLFDKYNILDTIAKDGEFQISALCMREFREPRLMAKFDHSINLPQIFEKHKLSILPITRGDYAISHFDAYHKFERDNSDIKYFSLPSHIQSLDSNNILNEAMALNYAVASGIIDDFIDDSYIYSTVSGRMSSGIFKFNIADNIDSEVTHKINVSNSQIEIDAAYEGINSLAILEAKRDISEDFLVRQLYYPYRLWKNKISKSIKPIFMIFSNGIYRFYEYEFEDPNNYSSLILVKQQKYSIEDMNIDITDIQDILNSVEFVKEPAIPFPQADRFERVINLCEILCDRELSRTEVTEKYAFDVRQTNYYTDAARYLGLVEKKENRKEKCEPKYTLTSQGRLLISSSYKQRQLGLCRAILSHKVFYKTLRHYFESGELPQTDVVIQYMQNSNLYQIESAETFRRRSQTIRSWTNWIVGLINKTI